MQGNGLIEMEVNKIRIDERRGEQIIVLREKGGARLLPIIIGISEVTAIKMKVSGIEPPRPLTHDLLHSAITELGAAQRQDPPNEDSRDRRFLDLPSVACYP